MRYKKELPIEPGFYWAKGGPQHPLSFERIVYLGEWKFHGELRLPLGEQADFWAGPLKHPKPPKEES